MVQDDRTAEAVAEVHSVVAEAAEVYTVAGHTAGHSTAGHSTADSSPGNSLLHSMEQPLRPRDLGQRGRQRHPCG